MYEAKLTSLIAKGDERAFETIFKAHYQNLCSYGYHFTKDMDQSEELVQQVFTDLWAKRADLNISSSIKSYLFRSVHNMALNKIKHEKVKREHALHVVHTTSEASEESDSPQFELKEQLESAIAQLPTECQRIFRLQRIDGMKYQEISDTLGISVKTVENQMGKALKILRTKLKHLMPAILVELLLNENFNPWL